MPKYTSTTLEQWCKDSSLKVDNLRGLYYLHCWFCDKVVKTEDLLYFYVEYPIMKHCLKVCSEDCLNCFILTHK